MSDAIDDFRRIAADEELRKVNADLQRRLRKAKAREEDLVNAAFEGAKAAMISLGPVAPITAPKHDKRKRKPEVALWHLTDWQLGKETTSYDSQVARRRVVHFCEVAQNITEIQRADHPVKDCTILLGGDTLEGLFNFPSQPFEIDATIFDQYTKAARLVADSVRFALSVYEKVNVVSEWGNHGRIGAKRAAVPRSDNLDRMVFRLSQEILGDEKRLRWQESAEDIQRVEIGNYKALLIHGDEIGRNGYASPMTIVNHVAKWKSGSYPWFFRDCYVGHYHQHQQWALPDGEGNVYMTGSPESDNRYAGVSMAASAKPSQRLHFVAPDKGRVTAQYQIWLPI